MTNEPAKELKKIEFVLKSMQYYIFLLEGIELF